MHPSRSETWENSRYIASSTENISSPHQATSRAEDCKSAKDFTGQLSRLFGQPGEKHFDYFVFYIVDYSLPRSGTRHCALAQTIGNARGLDIISPLSAENHLQDLQFHRHQQHGAPGNARGLDNNFASDRGCDSTTTTSPSTVDTILRQ
jgi:hypothetical protein